MTDMATRQTPPTGRGKISASRIVLLEALRQSTDAMTVQQLADMVTLHPNSVRFHLARLALAGLVCEAQASPTGPGRPRLVYTAIDPQVPNPSGHQLLAEALSVHLGQSLPSPRDVATEAGEEQGRRMVSHGPAQPPATEEGGKQAVTALMRDNGFEPQWDADGQRLWLRTCPFRPVSDHQPTVACSVHLGLMRGTLDALGAPLEVVSLDAAPAPHPCLAVFQPRQGPPNAPHDGDAEDVDVPRGPDTA